MYYAIEPKRTNIIRNRKIHPEHSFHLLHHYNISQNKFKDVYGNGECCYDIEINRNGCIRHHYFNLIYLYAITHIKIEHTKLYNDCSVIKCVYLTPDTSIPIIGLTVSETHELCDILPYMVNFGEKCFLANIFHNAIKKIDELYPICDIIGTKENPELYSIVNDMTKTISYIKKEYNARIIEQKNIIVLGMRHSVYGKDSPLQFLDEYTCKYIFDMIYTKN